MSIVTLEKPTPDADPYESLFSGEQRRIIEQPVPDVEESHTPTLPTVDRQVLRVKKAAESAIEIAMRHGQAVDIRHGLSIEQQLCLQRAVAGYALEASGSRIPRKRHVAAVAAMEVNLAVDEYGAGLISPRTHRIVVDSLERVSHGQQSNIDQFDSIVAEDTLEALGVSSQTEHTAAA